MPLPLSAGPWSLDPVHSVVQFSVRHLGIAFLKGRFGEVEATLSVGDDLGNSTLRAEVAMASIDTGNADRDGHLQSPDFFNTETHPTLSFSSTSIEAAGDASYRVNGTLTLNGQTGTETLDVTFFGEEDNPFDGSHRAGFNATTQIDRTAYGIDWNVPLASGGIMLGTTVDISIDAQLLASAD